jgi:ATP-dependent Clp protease ATP-binding subunit ClpA
MERGQPRHDPQPIEEMHRRIGNLKEKIDQLRREGRHDEAERLKREVDDIRRNIEEMERGSSHEQPHQGPSYNSEQRTRIINEAVDNMFKAAQRLHEANMHEQAEQLVREAEKFRREIQK